MSKPGDLEFSHGLMVTTHSRSVNCRATKITKDTKDTKKRIITEAWRHGSMSFWRPERHAGRSLTGVAPQRLCMPPLLSDFVFFVSFVAYSSWYPIRTANQTSQLPNFQLQV